jgi:hypothetical protein
LSAFVSSYVRNFRKNLKIPEAHRGEYVYSRRIKTFELSVGLQYKIWLHRDLPVGFAHAKMNETRKINDKIQSTREIEFQLEEFGVGAKSLISDADSAVP